MENKDYKSRYIDSKVQKYLHTFGAVCIEGPKWCGKTWTSEHAANSEIKIGDPSGNFQNRQLAMISPDLVLGGEAPHLIDEWQEVPELWDAVRTEVDKRNSKGQFILTGSATPQVKGVLHSGAGRIGRLRMRTMTLYEAGNSTGAVSLEDICRGRAETAADGEVKLTELIDLVLRGGWPGSQGLNTDQARIVAEDYLNAVLESDISRITDVRINTNKVEQMLCSLARNESTTASVNKLKNDIRETDGKGIENSTLDFYLDLLDRLFLLDNQKPFSTSMRSSVRVKQQEKRHFADPSLAASLLKATPEKLLGDLNTFGFLFEALVEHDLRIYAESFGAQLLHYQDYRGREIDSVIEMEDGSWCAAEIKLGANQIDAAAASLLKIRQEFENDEKAVPPSELLVVCGMSRAAYRRPDGVYVVPITSLRA